MLVIKYFLSFLKGCVASMKVTINLFLNQIKSYPKKYRIQLFLLVSMQCSINATLRHNLTKPCLDDLCSCSCYMFYCKKVLAVHLFHWLAKGAWVLIKKILKKRTYKKILNRHDHLWKILMNLEILNNCRMFTITSKDSQQCSF